MKLLTSSAVLLTLIAGAVTASAQQGPFLAWNSGLQYEVGDIVQSTYGGGSVKHLFRAIATSTNVNPATNAGGQWRFYEVNGNITINIGSTRTFTTLSQAYNYISEATIPFGTVTLKLDDGNYTENVDTSSASYSTFYGILINTPYGSHIRISGNTTDQSQVVITFVPSVTGKILKGIYVQGGTSLQMMEGLTLQADDQADIHVNSAGCGSQGQAFMQNITVKEFRRGFEVAQGGIIYGMKKLRAEDCDQWGFINTLGTLWLNHVSSGDRPVADGCYIAYATFGGQTNGWYGANLGVQALNTTSWAIKVDHYGRMWLPGSDLGGGGSIVGTGSLLNVAYP